MQRRTRAPAQGKPQISFKLKACSMCGRPFVATPGTRVCKACLEAEYRMEREVVDYVRDHPGARPKEIIEETGASEQLIRRMIEEGHFIDLGNIMFPCKKCGAPIKAGKYCPECYVKMKNSLQKAQANLMAKQKKTKKEKSDHTYSKSMKDDM